MVVILSVVQLEISIEKQGIVEMTAPDERRRMTTPLAHLPSGFDAHRPEKPSLTALAARNQAVFVIGTAGSPPLRRTSRVSVRSSCIW